MADAASGEKAKRSHPSDEQRVFVRTLNNELQKFNNFFINSEEDFVIREAQLEDEYKTVMEGDADGGAADDGESPGGGVSSRRLDKIIRAYANFHGELVLMQHWVSLNYTALVKILKKHDKRSRLSMRSPFLVSVLHQPFYSTEVLTQLTVKVEGRFRELTALTNKEVVPIAPLAERCADGAGVAARDGAPSDHSNSDSDDDQGDMGLGTRTKAAMDCWNGLKDSESILRPYGDVPVGRLFTGEPAGVKRGAKGELSPATEKRIKC